MTKALPRRPRRDDRTPTLFVVSDGRGDTGAAVLQAALVQYSGQPCAIVRHAGVRTAAQVEAVMAAAAEAHAVVLYTLVAHETRHAMQQAAAAHGLPVVDVLGPVLSSLHDRFHREPQSVPGLLYASEREKFDRHDAIDYTLTHDDGRRADELGAADVVLAGVSRAGKSSTCFYLAYQGVKAANVPLLPGVPLPDELLALPRDRVIGLWVNPGRLLALREARAQHLGMSRNGTYADLDSIKHELREAHRAMTDLGWRTIDASYLAIEEVARDVMRMRGLAAREPI